MKRKSFLNTLAVGTIGMLLPGKSYGSIHKLKGNGFACDKEWLLTEHIYDDYSAEIKCDALKEELKLIHISDSHLSILKNGVSELPEFTGRMDSAYKTPKHYLSGKEGTKQEHFESILDDAKKKAADLIILTGDIINNPTITNVNYVKDKLDKSGIEYFYVSGNHDWHFEGMEGKMQYLHGEWVKKRLKPLFKNENPFYYSKIIKGVNFVFIDNSTYQVNDEQVKFFREQSEKKYPIVLCMHIPIYQPSDLKRKIVETMGNPRWGAENDAYYKDERRERWPESGNESTTYQFLIEILSCRNLLAILAGHDHSAKQTKINPSAY